MYSYGTIMNPLGVKKVQRCPIEGTVPVTSCCMSKGNIFVPFLLRLYPL